MPTRKKVARQTSTKDDLLDQLGDGHDRHLTLLAQSRAARDRMVKIAVELTRLRGFSIAGLARDVGYASDEALAKKIRPLAKQLGLDEEAGAERYAPEYGGHSDAVLYGLFRDAHVDIAVHEIDAHQVFNEVVLPVASTLCLRHGETANSLMRRLGWGKNILPVALKQYWAVKRITPPTRHHHRPSSW